jgi:hypothetical protein
VVSVLFEQKPISAACTMRIFFRRIAAEKIGVSSVQLPFLLSALCKTGVGWALITWPKNHVEARRPINRLSQPLWVYLFPSTY